MLDQSSVIQTIVGGAWRGDSTGVASSGDIRSGIGSNSITTPPPGVTIQAGSRQESGFRYYNYPDASRYHHVAINPWILVNAQSRYLASRSFPSDGELVNA